MILTSQISGASLSTLSAIAFRFLETDNLLLVSTINNYMRLVKGYCYINYLISDIAEGMVP